jgi:hypothetical protein
MPFRANCRGPVRLSPRASLPGMSGRFVVRQRQSTRRRSGWLAQPERKVFARCNMSNAAKLSFLPGELGRGAGQGSRFSRARADFKTFAYVWQANLGRNAIALKGMAHGYSLFVASARMNRTESGGQLVVAVAASCSSRRHKADGR